MAVAAQVVRCDLDVRTIGGLTALDIVCDPADPARLRAFFTQGASRGAVSIEAQPGAAATEELREIAGGLMLVGRGAPVLGMAQGPVAVNPTPPEWALFDGRNCALAFRLQEPAETVGDWLEYHQMNFGLSGAVIVNRAPPDSPDFAADLAQVVAARGLEGLNIVVLHPCLPLGKPDMGPETHPYLAPDAPGKDRMEAPAPDPWLAPLAEGIILELLKWRYLGGARAVLLLDVCDILRPDQANPFDLCQMSGNGVIMLVGRRIYPWRVRGKGPAGFGDHICRQFDSRRGIGRWGCAPAKAGLDNSWKVMRVSYARPEAGAMAQFWRAMAIRVPGRPSSELAPKTSLIEDPDLIAMAEQRFAAKPVRPPVSKPRVETTDRTCIVTTMKNEGPFILEWLAWHRSIGVQDFLIYTNDCTDGTDTMLDMLQTKGIVQHRPNPWIPGGELKPQHAALQAAEGEEIVQRSGWAICMDVDEFINIKLGDGTLPTLYAAMEAALPGANMISLTWRLFGNGDVAEFADDFIIAQFPLCAQEIVRKPHQAWGFKTLFRNIDIYKKMGVHRPKGLKPDLWDQVKWLNGSGRPLPHEMFRNGWRSTLETYGYDWVQLNHYAVRSAESFLVKRDRGRVNHVDRDQGLNYWFRMNHNAVEDRSIMDRLPMLHAEFDRLMADPDIRAAHEHSVACHRAKIVELRATENYERFYSELTGPRLRALSRKLQHFGSAVFAAGPQVIPDDVALGDLAPDFFFTVTHEGEAQH
jgi:hypothetical protein